MNRIFAPPPIPFRSKRLGARGGAAAGLVAATALLHCGARSGIDDDLGGATPTLDAGASVDVWIVDDESTVDRTSLPEPALTDATSDADVLLSDEGGASADGGCALTALDEPAQAVVPTSWQLGLGAAAGDIRALAIDDAGNAYAAAMGGPGVGLALGSDAAVLVPGGTPPAFFDALAVKIAPAGTPLWAHFYGDELWHSGSGVAVGPSGSPVIVGLFQGTIDFGVAPLDSDGGVEGGSPTALVGASVGAFAAKLSPAGQPIWASLATPHANWAPSVAVGGNDDVVVGCPRATSNYGFVVRRMAPDGTSLWERTYPDGQSNAVAFDPDGNVLVAGFAPGNVDLNFSASLEQLDAGGAVLPKQTLEAGAIQGGAFLLKLDSSGNYVWSQRITGQTGASSFDFVLPSIAGLAVDGKGNVYTADDIDDGAGALDARVVERTPDGTVIATEVLSGSGSQVATALAVDSAGEVALVGTYDHELRLTDHGPPVLGPTQDSDLFVALFGADGRNRWVSKLGGFFDQRATAVAIDEKARALVIAAHVGTTLVDAPPATGDYFGTIDPALPMAVLRVPMDTLPEQGAPPPSPVVPANAWPPDAASPAAWGWHEDLQSTYIFSTFDPSVTQAVQIVVDRPTVISGFGWIGRPADADAGPNGTIELALYDRRFGLTDFDYGDAPPAIRLAAVGPTPIDPQGGRGRAPLASCVALLPGHYWIGVRITGGYRLGGASDTSSDAFGWTDFSSGIPSADGGLPAVFPWPTVEDTAPPPNVYLTTD